FMVFPGRRKFKASSLSPKTDFENSLFKVLESSEQDFRSILAQPDFTTQWNSWNVRTVLPGYDKCLVTQRSEKASHEIYRYECVAKGNSADYVEALFEKSISQLQSALPNWSLTQYSGDALKLNLADSPWLLDSHKLVILNGWNAGYLLRFRLAKLSDRNEFVLQGVGSAARVIVGPPHVCNAELNGDSASRAVTAGEYS